MTTQSREPHHFFHVEGVTLPKELRDVLVEQSKQDTSPRWDNIVHPDIVAGWQGRTRMPSEVWNTIDKVRYHPAHEGCDYISNWHTQELKVLFDLIHPTAKEHIEYIILQRTQPNGWMSPHKDWEHFQERRKAVMFFPLTPYSAEEWAPLTFYKEDGQTKVAEVEFSPCYVADTQRVHGYENNDNYRASVAIAFDCGEETLYTLYEQGKLIA